MIVSLRSSEPPRIKRQVTPYFKVTESRAARFEPFDFNRCKYTNILEKYKNWDEIISFLRLEKG